MQHFTITDLIITFVIGLLISSTITLHLYANHIEKGCLKENQFVINNTSVYSCKYEGGYKNEIK